MHDNGNVQTTLQNSDGIVMSV